MGAIQSKKIEQGQELTRDVEKAIEELDKKVDQRDGKQVLEKDSPEVEEICAKIGSWLQNEACHHRRLKQVKEIFMDQVPGVMKRYRIFDGDAIEIRIHYFKDTSEINIHNHRMNFFSYCLKGSYLHKVHNVSTGGGQEHHYYATNRTQDPRMEYPMQKFNGALYCMSAQIYGEGSWYFLDHRTPHTVQPRDGSALTIYVKSKCQLGDSWVWSHDPSLPADSWTQDTPIEGKEKSDFLQEIWQLLQPTSS